LIFYPYASVPVPLQGIAGCHEWIDAFAHRIIREGWVVLTSLPRPELNEILDILDAAMVLIDALLLRLVFGDHDRDGFIELGNGDFETFNGVFEITNMSQDQAAQAACNCSDDASDNLPLKLWAHHAPERIAALTG
jgi:hypothetical protein